MNVLSIQSDVVYGHVGNGAARFALHRLGHEVWALPTVLLSNHAGFPNATGETLSAGLLRQLVDGIAANGHLARCDAVLSGYLGHADQAAVVAHAVREVKAANPKAIYCLDPVIGDGGRAYVKPGVAEAVARLLLPLSDIVTPNAFELTTLAGMPIRNADDAREAARRLGRPLVVATSVPDGDGRIGTLAMHRNETWFASTPLLSRPTHGSGDLLAALFLAHRLAQRSLKDALSRATASEFHILSESAKAQSPEMLLIENQDALVEPPANSEIRVAQIV
jgi:pyridoxine kinase